MLWLLILLSPMALWTGLFWIAPLGAWACPVGSEKFISVHNQVRLRFKWLLVWESLGVETGASLRVVCPLVLTA